MAKYIGKVTATVGTYKDNGVDKKRYVTCGAAFEDEQGRVSFKLDVVPCSPEWSGWFSIYPPDDDRQQGGQQQSRPASAKQTVHPRQQARPQHQDAGGGDGMDDSDIPFARPCAMKIAGW